ncbi:recombinase family protein [Chryseobacterium luquanense]|uniref:Recombinase family protein n=1 Tax=Chryseobacterium luquanense TaxID=2983766 RepID=A0ABT3XY99_9FLAO|nr:recombinase family protein [Chryseobacterium luquanense]MCX8530873.1 recombinase family protein [Chryseobacterium luquanense]
MTKFDIDNELLLSLADITKSVIPLFAAIIASYLTYSLFSKKDRIFRSLKNMIDLIEKFNEKGILFKSITEPAFDTTSANGKFIIQIFGAVAEFERNLISERTKSGLEGARRRKKLLGRPKGSSQKSIEKYQFAKHLYDNKNTSIDKACKQAGISKATFYRIDNTIKIKLNLK